ncbi:MAG: SsrA-binding protein SmpB [Rhodobacteraceae bacterium]|nr:SsrA-binding protein SmpB [Paracoccaceae bacterium]
MSKSPEEKNYKILAVNRRARHDYFIESELECGILLHGSEVKSLRTAQCNIAESYASVENQELWLINSYIAPYEKSRYFRHEERRNRKLLVSKKELAKLWSNTKREGKTLVPLVLYFNHKGLAKVKIGIAKGKKLVDKRQTEQKRDWKRNQQRLLKKSSK